MRITKKDISASLSARVHPFVIAMNREGFVPTRKDLGLLLSHENAQVRSLATQNQAEWRSKRESIDLKKAFASDSMVYSTPKAL